MNAVEYQAMQDQVALLSSVILGIDAEELAEFIGMAERANSLGPVLDATAWTRGHDQLRVVIAHARAIAAARRDIELAVGFAGASR